MKFIWSLVEIDRFCARLRTNGWRETSLDKFEKGGQEIWVKARAVHTETTSRLEVFVGNPAYYRGTNALPVCQHPRVGRGNDHSVTPLFPRARYLTLVDRPSAGPANPSRAVGEVRLCAGGLRPDPASIS